MQTIFDSENNSIIRIDKGEECLSVLKSLAKSKNLSFNFSMIGGCSEVELQYYDAKAKKYFSKIFDMENIEILSVNGNVCWHKNEPIVHAHGVFSDESYESFGGHVSKLIISLTGETIVDWLPEKIYKKEDEKTGLKLFCAEIL
ncbi:MAG TPA: PPC domain-containing DNA-binding protein [Candidatus Paceibacterota bacterium]|nr:PPC domain-containing DNA-binding protein [Candidatus Paceibacterota bacterium]